MFAAHPLGNQSIQRQRALREMQPQARDGEVSEIHAYIR